MASNTMGTRITRFYDSTTITNPIAAKRFASRSSRESFIDVKNTSIFYRISPGSRTVIYSYSCRRTSFELSENETGGVTRR